MSISIDLQTGELKAGIGNLVFCCKALGSCIAIALIDKQKPIGGLAHIMMPGSAPLKSLSPNRYAENAIKELLSQLKSYESSMDLIAVIAGGGNVLKRENDTICESNSQSVHQLLNKLSIPIVTSSVGGYERRSIKYILNEQMVKYSIGDSKEMLLYRLSNTVN